MQLLLGVNNKMIICAANQKGGVGKTTTIINLGAALAGAGKPTLLIDLDPQGSLSQGLGFQPHEVTGGSYQLFRNKPVEIISIDANLAVLPTNIDLADIPGELIGNRKASPSSVLKRSIKPLVADFNYILIDTPPNLDYLTLNALGASQYVIIPCQCQLAAVRGLERFARTLEDLLEVNNALEVLALIPTMYTASRKIEQDLLAVLQKDYGDKCRPPLPDRVEYLRAYAEQRPVSGELFDYWKDFASFVIEKAGV
jgi:chromosome partitioning protein